MKKLVILFVLFALLLVGCGFSKEDIVQTAIAQTQESSPTITETSSSTITSSPAPSEIQFFRDNNIVKKVISEHPKGVCTQTESGWECNREMSNSGRWSLHYYKDSDSYAEIYESEYLDTSGLEKDDVIEVLASTTAICANESITESITDWLGGEGVAQALQEDAGVISKKFGEITVFLSFTDTGMDVSLCHGEWCD